MTPFAKRALLVLAGAVIGSLPVAFPALAPLSELFAAVAGTLVGGAAIPRPGDTKGGAR